jgi:hypothetical protein
MKNFLILFLMILFPSMAVGKDVPATGSDSGPVLLAINTALDGDRVVVPSGVSTWNATISKYPMPSITIIAGGGTNGTTTLTQNMAGPFFDFQPKKGGSVTIKGFNFIEGNPSTSVSTMTVNCTSNSFWRICNNNFDCQQGIFVYNAGSGAGLIDNNYFKFYDNGDIWKIFGDSNQNGDGAPLYGAGGVRIGNWAYGVNYGSTNCVVIEHNTAFSTATAQTPDGPLEAYEGAKFVVRYNSLTNCGQGGWHGTDSGGAIAPHSWELYLNDYYYINSFCSAWIKIFDSRGGTGLVWSNTAHGFVPKYGFQMTSYRWGGANSLCATTLNNCSPWGNMTGSNPYDGNTNADGWPGLAQNGTTGPLGGYVVTGLGTSSSEVLSPIYCWGNNFVCDNATGGVDVGRDYYTNNIGFSGTSFTNFPGSPGLVYTPLAYPYPGINPTFPSVNAASVNESDVLSACSQVAQFGTVNIPSGTANWTNTLFLSNNIFLKGYGAASTFITNGTGGPLIKWFPTNNAPIRLGFISFLNQDTNVGAIRIYGPISTMQVDHCNFNKGDAPLVFNPAGIGTDVGSGPVYGVVDWCNFTNCSRPIFVCNRQSNDGGVIGAADWASGVVGIGNNLSDTNQIYYEADGFSWDSSYVSNAASIYGYGGGKVTVRFSSFTGSSQYIDLYGDNAGVWNSVHYFRVYATAFNYGPYGPQDHFAKIRGGAGTIFQVALNGYPDSSALELITPNANDIHVVSNFYASSQNTFPTVVTNYSSCLTCSTNKIIGGLNWTNDTLGVSFNSGGWYCPHFVEMYQHPLVLSVSPSFAPVNDPYWSP